MRCTVFLRFLRTRPRRLRNATLAALSALVTVLALAVGVPQASAATSLPCDIYATAGTPCVAAHSLVRALYSSYNGSLYQVQRASDSTTANIGPLAAGGMPTRRRRTRSVPVRPASSPRSTTSPRATTTSRSRARAGPVSPMSGRPRTRCR